MNPMVSFATMLAGLTEFPRCVIYIGAQIVGCISATYTVKHILTDKMLNLTQLAMCSIGTDHTPSQVSSFPSFPFLPSFPLPHSSLVLPSIH